MAYKDFKALTGMMDSQVFDDEIFGFHAQQAIEKTLKAWLALLGKEYPLTHDISALLDLLRASGQDIEEYWDLLEYNVYAVRFRYESLQVYDEALDGKTTVTSIEKLIENVRHMLGRTLEQ
ncbi:MAG: HEPN domain-containing protein [Thermodesulfobacteriota bacterium]